MTPTTFRAITVTTAIVFLPPALLSAPDITDSMADSTANIEITALQCAGEAHFFSGEETGCGAVTFLSGQAR